MKYEPLRLDKINKRFDIQIQKQELNMVKDKKFTLEPSLVNNTNVSEIHKKVNTYPIEGILSGIYELVTLHTSTRLLTKSVGWQEDTGIRDFDELSFSNDVIYYYGLPIIPLSRKNIRGSYEKEYFHLELLTSLKLFDNNFVPKTFCSLDVFGPDDVKNNTLYVNSDWNRVIANIRRSYGTDDKYISVYKKFTWGSDYTWKKVDDQLPDINHKLTITDIKNTKDVMNVLKYIGDNTVDVYFIRKFGILGMRYCAGDYTISQQLLAYFGVISNTLKIGGSLVIDINFPIISTVRLEVLQFISSFFNETNVFYPQVNGMATYYVCRDYKGITDSEYDNLMKTINAWYDYDPSMGFALSQDLSHKICVGNEKKKNDNLNFIRTLGFNISKEFYLFIGQTNMINIKRKEAIADRHEQIRNTLDSLKPNEKRQYSYSVLGTNMKLSVEWCRENNVQINSIYINKNGELLDHILTSEYILESLFPKHKDMKKLMISSVGLYNTTKVEHLDIIKGIINKYIDPKDMTLTDVSNYIGNNDVLFTELFKHVNIVERDSAYNVNLETNLKIYERTNFTINNNKYNKICKELKQDVVFLDVPLDGIGYMDEAVFDLYINGQTLPDIIKKIDDKCKLIMVKLPHHYKFYNLSDISTKTMTIHRLINYALVIFF
jgi:hypothetical protein